MDTSIEMIQELSNAYGISGFEDDVIEVIKKYAKEYAHVEEDHFRNLYLYTKNNQKGAPIVMIDGHSDEVGFMVQSIKRNGTLSFVPIGGWIADHISSQRVKIKNAKDEYITGIVASKPLHFMKQNGREQKIDIQNMVIDIGATSRDEVIEKFHIEVGCPVIPDVTFHYEKTNDMMMGKAFDNRIGCACVIEVLKNLYQKDMNVNVVGTISSQEEVGLRGAKITAHRVNPSVAIVFEGTPADDLYVDLYEAQAIIKEGPQIRHRDGSMIAHPRFVKFARNIAKSMNIPFQDAVRTSGGTNAGAIHLAYNGVPTIVIGIPVRYIHTHQGFCALKDFKNAIKWATKIITTLDKEILESF